MQSDTIEHGVAYWHVDHQIPGVLVCPLHRKLLLIATDKVSGQDRFGWVLPGQVHLKNLLTNNRLHGGEHLLAESALELWKLPISFTFAHDRMSTLYKAKLVEQNFVHAASSRVDYKRFEQALSLALTASSMAMFWPWIAGNYNTHIFSRRLLRICHPTSSRFSRHPLNHLPLIFLLFGSWSSFWSAYHQPEQGKSDRNAFNEIRPVLRRKESSDSNKQLRVSLIEKIRSGEAVSRAAELIGIAVTTAMTWAASEGIQSPRRPKVLKPDVRSLLIRQLKRGANKTVAASLARISVVTVTRVLMTEPGLHAQWSAARFINAQTRSRRSWQKSRQAFPESPSNEWRKLDPAAYAWLYRNDRSWLQSSIENRPAPRTISVQRRDWKNRDASLAQAVRLAALDWHLSHSGKRLTIGALCSSVDGLRQKISTISKLPLARKAIEEACSSSRPTASKLQKSLKNDDPCC